MDIAGVTVAVKDGVGELVYVGVRVGAGVLVRVRVSVCVGVSSKGANSVDGTHALAKKPNTARRIIFEKKITACLVLSTDL